MTHDRQLYIQDVTLRDGMHAIRHRYHARATSARSSAALDAAGVDAIEVAHGDGLAGGQPQLRPRQRTPTGSGSRRRPRTSTQRAAHHAAAARASARSHDLQARLRPRRPLGARRHALHRGRRRRPAHRRPPASSGMDVSGFLMMSHMAAPAELAAAGQADGVLRRALRLRHRLRRPADDGRRRATGSRAYRDVLDPATEIGIHAHENLSLVGRQLGRRRRGGRRPASTPRWPGMGAGAGNCPIEAFIAVADLHGLAARLRPVRAAGRRRRPRPAAAGPAGAGRPRDAHARLRRRLLQLPAARRGAPPSATASTSATILVEVGRRGTGRRPGGHDRRRRADLRAQSEAIL